MKFTKSRSVLSGRDSLRRWMILGPIGLALLVAVALALTLLPDSPRRLTYGQFRAQLAAGRVTALQVGPKELIGTLRDASGTSVRFRAARLGMEQDAELHALMAEHIAGGNYDAEDGPSAARGALVPLVLLLSLGVLGWFVYRRGGLGSAMAFARSRHKVYDPAKFRVTFDDIAGIDEAVDELTEVVEFLKNPEKFARLGGRIPKGVLLVGPPGTGKTLLARAVAGEAGVPFYALSGSDFMEMYVGVGAARVRNLFAQAEATAPCLVFIDEIDAIGKARSSGGTSGGEERDQTLNQLLVCMDGFAANAGVIVMAATNRPETLDAALVRPGRFDRNVTVDRPDLQGREQILRVHVRNMPVGDEIDLRQIAAMTTGFVGADLANLVNEAALLAARKGKGAVGRDEFEEGVERILAGPQKRQRVLRPEDRERIAVHEAGHALIARSLPGTDPVHKVTIIGRGSGALGYTMYRPEDERFLHTRSWLENYICTLLGGTVAEEVVYGEFSDGATSDLQRATEVARKMVAEFGMSPRLGRVSYQGEARGAFLPGAGSGKGIWSEETAREIDLEVRNVLDSCLARTRALCEARRAALDDVAAALVERETIDARELQEILDHHPAAA